MMSKVSKGMELYLDYIELNKRVPRGERVATVLRAIDKCDPIAIVEFTGQVLINEDSQLTTIDFFELYFLRLFSAEAIPEVTGRGITLPSQNPWLRVKSAAQIKLVNSIPEFEASYSDLTVKEKFNKLSNLADRTSKQAGYQTTRETSAGPLQKLKGILAQAKTIRALKGLDRWEVRQAKLNDDIRMGYDIMVTRNSEAARLDVKTGPKVDLYPSPDKKTIYIVRMPTNLPHHNPFKARQNEAEFLATKIDNILTRN